MKGAILWPPSTNEETFWYLLQYPSDAVRGSGPVRFETNTGKLFHRSHYSRLDPLNATVVCAPTAAGNSSCLPMDSWPSWVRGAASGPVAKTPDTSLRSRKLYVSCCKSGWRGWMKRSIVKDGFD